MRKGKKLDWVIVFGLGLGSLMVVGFTVWQQFRQVEASYAEKVEQLKHKDEIIKELTNIITGGDSYLFLRPSLQHRENELTFLVEAKGKYPLYDVSITYSEYDIIHESSVKERYRKVKELNVNMGTVNPLLTDNLKFSDLPKSDEMLFGKRFFFRIKSRNGYSEEEVFVRKAAAEFAIAYQLVHSMSDYSNYQEGQLFKSQKIKKLIRHIDEEFPIDEITHVKGDTGWEGDYTISTGKELKQ